mgnify:CR=1 FL=1
MTATEVFATCAVCGGEFIPRHSLQKYCSAECSRLAHLAVCRNCRAKKKLSDGRPALVKCAVCGEEFEPKNINQKYCSPECKAAHDRDRAREKWQKQNGLQYPCEKPCVDCGQNFIAYKANSKRCPKCQEAFRAICNIKYQHKRYLRDRTSDKPYQPQQNTIQILGLTDEEYAFTPKPKNPRKHHRSPEENHAIIDDKVRKAREFNLSYGEYDACLLRGIDPARRVPTHRHTHSERESDWLDSIFAITGKI